MSNHNHEIAVDTLIQKESSTLARLEGELAIMLAQNVRHDESEARYGKSALNGKHHDQFAIGAARTAIAEQQLTLSAARQDYTGWTRAYLVTNSNGHVHRTMSCDTCFASTEFYWLTELSGMNETEVVTLAGEKACTVCYPSAPVDLYRQRSTITTPERRAREAEKAARQAAKDAKAITAPDGSALRVPDGYGRTERLDTLAAAWAFASAAISNHEVYGYADKSEAVDMIVTAIAAKLDQPEQEIRAEVERKAAAKSKRDAKESAKYARQIGL